MTMVLPWDMTMVVIVIMIIKNSPFRKVGISASPSLSPAGRAGRPYQRRGRREALYVIGSDESDAWAPGARGLRRTGHAAHAT
jgi:hypothetical protein